MAKGLANKEYITMLQFILDNNFLIFIFICLGLLPSHIKAKAAQAKQSKTSTLFSKLNTPLKED